MGGSRRRTRAAQRQLLAQEFAPRVAAEVARLRQLSYEDIAQLVDRQDLLTNITASTGDDLVLNTTVVWDGGGPGDVRVIVDVWWPGDPRWVKHSLATDSFIMAPEGTFIDEDDASGRH